MSISLELERPREPNCFNHREANALSVFLNSPFVRREDLQLFGLRDTDGADRRTLCSVIGRELRVQYPDNKTHNSGKNKRAMGNMRAPVQRLASVTMSKAHE